MAKGKELLLTASNSPKGQGHLGDAHSHSPTPGAVKPQPTSLRKLQQGQHRDGRGAVSGHRSCDAKRSRFES